jgi:hypothetical protein
MNENNIEIVIKKYTLHHQQREQFTTLWGVCSRRARV